MLAFITRVNASLPTTEPDVILLSLVKGHSGEVCGISCPPSQVASGGRCVARAVVAAAEPPADLSPVPPRATVAMADPETQPADTPRRAPPPGRMSIGGPTPDNAVPAPPVTGWPAPDGERLPWMKDPAAPPAVAAVAPEDLPEEDDVSPSRRPAGPVAGGSTPPPRKYAKPRSRQQASKPNQKKRYATRSVQMLFLHPLGRM
jgi:hypothetical protein